MPRDVAVGDQAALERWSELNGVFEFIRVEDIAYDRTTPNVVYFADTGEPQALHRRGPARMTAGRPAREGRSRTGGSSGSRSIRLTRRR